MRILQITPGTGNFYCGACLRDHALVTALRNRGHDAVMIPMYLPLLLEDSVPVEGSGIFFGGINVYLQQKLRLFHKTPRWLDRLLDSKALLQWSSRLADMTSARDLGELTVSMLSGEEGRQIKELNRLLKWLKEMDPPPDVISLSNALLIGLIRGIKRQLDVPVVVSLQGEDSFLDALPQPYRDRAWELMIERSADADCFIAVSHYYGDLMKRRLNLSSDRLRVIHNGIALEGFEPASQPPAVPKIGYLARMTKVKGLDILIDSFFLLKKKLAHKNTRLGIAGALTSSDESYVNGLKRRLSSEGLEAFVDFLPNLSSDAKKDFLRSLTVLSVPVRYGEPFGLYVLEALACGVPVVEPNASAFPELMEATQGGILYEPNEPSALASALESLLNDPQRARRMGLEGRKTVLERFSIDRMTDEVLSLFNEVVH